jgi:hypothetical protein
MTMTATTTLRLVATLLCFPGVLAHELTHYAVARWVAVDLRLSVGARPAVTVAQWRETASWGIVAAAYAPLLVGLCAGAGVLVWALVAGWPAVESIRDVAVALLGAGWYAVYVLPSGDDIETAQEGFDRVQA